MTNWFSEWLPWIPPASLSGVFNLLVAYRKLDRDCRSPLFNPWRSPGFWLWTVVQFALPILVLWFYVKIQNKPSIDFSLYWTAVLVGFAFTPFVNANADLGFVNFSVDKIYEFLNEIAYKSIAAEQTAQLANFKQDFKQNFIQKPSNLDFGLDWLKGYFDGDVSFKNDPKEQHELLAEVEQAMSKTIPEEKVAAVIALVMKVRRRDCKNMLQERFGCSEAFLNRYFHR